MGASLCRTITCAGGGGFSGNGVWPSLYDVVVSWLRLQTPTDCIPHPYWMYTKCFITLRCCGWVYGCIIIAVIRVYVGVNFWGNVVWPSLYDVVVSLLRLQTPIDCIPHPYWMYTQCFCTWRCCRWAYGCTPLCRTITCAGGGEFQENKCMAEPV